MIVNRGQGRFTSERSIRELIDGFLETLRGFTSVNSISKIVLLAFRVIVN